MKQISNWFIPPFLRRLDAYLLRNYPVVWRTKAVFVLFYGIVAAPLLFVAGLLYAHLTLDAQHLVVEPIAPIEMGYDVYHLWSAVFAGLGIAYWAYIQYELGFPFTKMTDTLLTLFLHALCFFVLFGITTPAFRMGTIVKTAHYWMSDEDMQYFEKSGIYPYGFVLLPSDTNYTTTPADTFFQRREAILKAIHHVEDTLLQNRYNRDSIFGINWLRTHNGRYKLRTPNISYLSSSSPLAYLSSLSPLLDIISLDDNSSLGNRYYTSDLTSLHYLSPDVYYSSLWQLSYKCSSPYFVGYSYDSYVSHRKYRDAFLWRPNYDYPSSQIYLFTYQQQKTIELPKLIIDKRIIKNQIRLLGV